MPSGDIPGQRGLERPADVPEDEFLEENGAVVGAIIVRVGDVFDPDRPGEDRRLFRWANRLHRNTRDRVVRRLLLLESGDRYSRRKLEESERILRSARYLYDARIRPVRYEGNRVDVLVETRDVWTLQGGFGFSREGGANSTRIGFQDSNFLGLGKDLTFRRTTSVDRTRQLYRYRDDNVLGSRVQLQVSFEDNSDGQSHGLMFGRPFFSLDTRWSAGIVVTSFDQVDPLYSLGEIDDRFRHRRSQVEGFAGFSRGWRDGRVVRWRAGFAYDRDRFEPAAGYPEPGLLPDDRRLIYPWIGLEVVEDGFVEAHDMDRISRTEDFNLAQDFRLRIGWISRAFGADRSMAIWRGDYRVGLNPGAGQVLLAEAHTEGRWGEGRVENVVAGGSLRFYVRNLGRHLFFVVFSADASANLDRDRQLLLGGDSGLRGYPLRYQEGNRRVLLTLEQRFYTGRQIFKLAHVGAAVFLDAGAAWFEGPRSGESLGLLQDVGVGLRLGSSRSAKASVVHVDLAMPLTSSDSRRNLQLLVNTRETF